MNKIKISIIAIAATAGLAFVAPVPTVGAAPEDDIHAGVQAIGGNDAGGTLATQIEDIVNLMLYILGAIAVVMIVIGGIRYATSNGESSQISSAKNTILYAVIGLVVAVMAYAIVNFVLASFD